MKLAIYLFKTFECLNWREIRSVNNTDKLIAFRWIACTEIKAFTWCTALNQQSSALYLIIVRARLGKKTVEVLQRLLKK